MPKVSIILPSYNHNRFLKDRINSIVNQTYQDFELIIIDDCSTDGSIETLKAFVNEYSHIVKHFIINEENSGSGYTSWKKGIELADSGYIWIAETDDYSHSEFLEKSVSVLDKNNECALVFCNSNYIDVHNHILYDSSNRTERLEVYKDGFDYFNDEVLLREMPFNTLITNGSGVVFRKPYKSIPTEVFKHKQSSDLFLWTYLVRGNVFGFLSEKLNYFRRHEGSTTTKFSKSNSSKLYLERAEYINYFEEPKKHEQFIKHYIKYFINVNKRFIFYLDPILKIENVSGLRQKYMRFLLSFYYRKMKLKLLK